MTAIGLMMGLGTLHIDVQQILITILVLTVSLSFHEYAHAWMAHRLGDNTAAEAGRLSMNPARHLDPIGAAVFLVTRRIGWAKPVPVNPARFRPTVSLKRGFMLTSVAGPLANIVLSMISVVWMNVVDLVAVLTHATMDDVWVRVLMNVGLSFFFANLTLAVFNLLPLPPLDGFKVFGALLPASLYRRILNNERQIAIIMLIVFVAAGSLVQSVMRVLITPFQWLVAAPINFVFDQLRHVIGVV